MKGREATPGHHFLPGAPSGVLPGTADSCTCGKEWCYEGVKPGREASRSTDRTDDDGATSTDGMTPDEIRSRAVNNEGYTGHLWPVGDVRQELANCPIGPHMLADNEVDDYLALERVLHRHDFYDHDCQFVGCAAMFLLNSPEFTEILHRAHQRGRTCPSSPQNEQPCPDCDGYQHRHTATCPSLP